MLLYSGGGSVKVDLLVGMSGLCNRQIEDFLIPVNILRQFRQLTVHRIHHEIRLLNQ